MKLRRVYGTSDISTAQAALRAARAAGIGDDDLLLIARSDIELEQIPDQRKDANTDLIPAALRGAVGGAIVGLLAGLVAMVIPAIHLPLIGVGIAVLAGAAIGGWVSALLGATVPDPVRRAFAEEIEAGRILLLVDADQATLAHAEAAILHAGAQSLHYQSPRSLS